MFVLLCTHVWSVQNIQGKQHPASGPDNGQKTQESIQEKLQVQRLKLNKLIHPSTAVAIFLSPFDA